MNRVGIAIASGCSRRFACVSVSPAQYGGPNLITKRNATNHVPNNDDELLSSSTSSEEKSGRRVWRAIQDTDDEWTNILNSKNNSSIAYLTADGTSSAVETKHWRMAHHNDRRSIDESLSRICEQVSIEVLLIE